jgi:CheY-like chemotaxis protein
LALVLSTHHQPLRPCVFSFPTSGIHEATTSAEVASSKSLDSSQHPLPMVSVAQQKTARKRLHQRMDNNAKAPRILIVDDVLVNRKLLERTFVRAAQKLGVAAPTIRFAVNGQEAVDMVVASLPSSPETIDIERGGAPASQPFHLICLDRQMPVLDGVGATRKIKALQDGWFAHKELKPAYLVGMSASIENTAEWLAAGLDQMLPKPFTGPDIAELLLAMYPSKSSAAVSPRKVAATALPGHVPEDLFPPTLSLPRPAQ